MGDQPEPGSAQTRGPRPRGGVPGKFGAHEGRGPEQENTPQTPPPPPSPSPVPAGQRGCGAQRGHVSLPGLLLPQEAAVEGCSGCGTGGRGPSPPAPRSPDPRADRSRLFPDSTTELHSSAAAAAAWRGVFFGPGLSPSFLRRLIA